MIEKYEFLRLKKIMRHFLVIFTYCVCSNVLIVHLHCTTKNSNETNLANEESCWQQKIWISKKWKNKRGSRLFVYLICTVFENHRKSLIHHCELSELRLHFEWTKVDSKCQNWSILASFWKTEACGQTVLTDRSVLIGQNLGENVKNKKNATFC